MPFWSIRLVYRLNNMMPKKFRKKLWSKNLASNQPSLEAPENDLRLTERPTIKVSYWNIDSKSRKHHGSAYQLLPV
jgi:hypothetical protein